MRSLSHAKGASATVQRRLQAMGDDMARRTQEMLEEQKRLETSPTTPPMPQNLGDPSLAPQGPPDFDDNGGP